MSSLSDVTFFWEGGGSEVFLQGSFDDWKIPGTPMIKIGHQFVAHLALPDGRYEYKYIVDGENRYDCKKKMTPDGAEGQGFNNICEVTGSNECQLSVSTGVKKRHLATVPVQPSAMLSKALESGHESSSLFKVPQISSTSYASKQTSQQQYNKAANTKKLQKPKTELQEQKLKEKPSLPVHTLKVTCLANTVTSTMLNDVFKAHGTLVGFPVIHRSKKPYAHINFTTLEGAQRAIDKLNKFVLEGNSIKVSLRGCTINPSSEFSLGDNPKSNKEQHEVPETGFLSASSTVLPKDYRAKQTILSTNECQTACQTTVSQTEQEANSAIKGSSPKQEGHSTEGSSPKQEANSATSKQEGQLTKGSSPKQGGHSSKGSTSKQGHSTKGSSPKQESQPTKGSSSKQESHPTKGFSSKQIHSTKGSTSKQGHSTKGYSLKQEGQLTKGFSSKQGGHSSKGSTSKQGHSTKGSSPKQESQPTKGSSSKQESHPTKGFSSKQESHPTKGFSSKQIHSTKGSTSKQGHSTKGYSLKQEGQLTKGFSSKQGHSTKGSSSKQEARPKSRSKKQARNTKESQSEQESYLMKEPLSMQKGFSTKNFGSKQTACPTQGAHPTKESLLEPGGCSTEKCSSRSATEPHGNLHFSPTVGNKEGTLIVKKLASPEGIQSNSKQKCSLNPVFKRISAVDLSLQITKVLSDNILACNKQIFHLHSQKEQNKIPKNPQIDLFMALKATHTAILYEIHELENRLTEFSSYCHLLLKRLESGLDMTVSQVETLDNWFKRENSRFQKGLPIYSHRREIVEMVRASQISILTAETGSGKSTQLVQYLYEEGFAETGIIVCTQPRKVAAMSLAKYVSSEMLETPGTIVGYKTGVRGNSCDQTRVMYMTDHTLLNECVHDSSFSKYSCLIIDEAHERNLNTDVLLAFIKRCLPNRPDLRVIITSATIDPDMFLQYFDQGSPGPVMQIPGRTFSVDVVYCPPSNDQNPQSRRMPTYIGEAIDLVNCLHESEPEGDILVFLTSPGEVELACNALEKSTKSSAIVLPLHGKLQPNDQQKVFKTYHKRKIVFSTNVAETSVTIPGVKYIVDSGRAKELCFDAKKNMNSLEVRTISKSSAEQRKGRAGRTSAGKCYRLYAEDEYKGMSDRLVPEILRVALAGTVLKLYELGIKEVLTFDFIEKPEKEALEAAAYTLEFLGAVSNHQLTDIGKKMASLPIDPRLSKIVLDGIDEGVGPEAIATVAISSLAGTIFFRGGTDDMKERSDLFKGLFCHSSGDQITHLLTYSQWILQKSSGRNAWCTANSINAKSMRIVQETINDLKTTLKRDLKVLSLSSNSFPLDIEKASKTIPRLYFEAYADNVCAFLGHERIGYFNCNLPNEKLQIFPASSLCCLNQNPPLLAFEKTLKTSQHFLLQAFPVKQEWVQEALQSGKLSCHPTRHDQYEQLAVGPFVIDDLGTYVLNLVVQNQSEIIIQATDTNLKGVQFIASPEQGLLKVFVQPRFHEPIQRCIQDFIKTAREKLLKSQFESGVTKDDDNVRVVIGCGACVNDVLMPNQYRTLIVSVPKGYLSLEEIIRSLSMYGPIEKYNLNSRNQLFVTFSDAISAERACSLDIPDGFSIKPKMFKKKDGLTVSSLSLKLEWNRRERRNFVNIEFDTASEARDVLSQLSQTSYVDRIRFNYKFAPSKFNSNQIFVYNVSPHLTETQVKETLSRTLTSCGYVDGSYRVIFCYSEKFETTLDMLESIELELNRLISPYASRYTINILPPENFHKKYIAFVNFHEQDKGVNAMHALQHTTRTCFKEVKVSLSLSSAVQYSSTLYAAVESSLNEAVSSILILYRSVRVNKKQQDDYITIRIQSDSDSDHLSEYVAALNKLNMVLQPQVIQCCSPMLSEYFRTKKCEEDIKRIEELTSTVVRKDFQLKCLKIYGTETNTTKAMTEFDQCLLFLHDGTKYFEVELKKGGRPPGLFKYLITTFGTDLQLLIDRKGIAMARVDIRKQLLILFATDAGHHLILEIIDVFSTNNASNVQLKHTSTTQVDCCACYTPIEKSEDSYRLEYCGHAYHYECIEAQLAPNTIVVPIQCAADGCSQSFVWQDFDNLHCKKKLDLRNVITESVRTYLAANQETVRNCPTPDCSMVYTVADDKGCFLCSHCGVITCTKCHKPFHSGLTCAMNESAIKSESEKHLEAWLQRNQSTRKRCPGCAVPIEKTEGCAHVCCRQCRAHICWKCRAFFPNEQECYKHLQLNHDRTFM